ncbi:hypothetical protein A6I77_08845 [Achromobacter xylosoxidans]|uniref:hypothetical protein n=1 Tax=Achromobacter dolens TaxID=1287738 RepID=UPI0007E1A5F6|nr:hypothetical protein A6I77_08845 [Achromobacter xylosoxidans]
MQPSIPAPAPAAFPLRAAPRLRATLSAALSAACAAAALIAQAPAGAETAAARDPIVAERSATALPGSGRGWGFAVLARDGAELLLARRENGLTAYDTARRQALARIPGTEGANAVAAVPSADRLYVAGMDDTEVYPADGGESQRHFTADSFTVTALRLREARP